MTLTTWQILHCVKSVQIRSFFWSYKRKIRNRRNSVFGHFSRSVIYIALCLKIAAHLLFLGRAYEYQVILSLKKKKWEMESMKFLKIFISLIFRSSPSEVLKRILVLNIFSIFRENLSCKVYYHLECFGAPVTGGVWRF